VSAGSGKSERFLILRLLIPGVDRDSAVGIAIRYGLDGPRIESW
jgi:hypothetical protein